MHTRSDTIFLAQKLEMDRKILPVFRFATFPVTLRTYIVYQRVKKLFQASFFSPPPLWYPARNKDALRFHGIKKKGGKRGWRREGRDSFRRAGLETTHRLSVDDVDDALIKIIN